MNTNSYIAIGGLFLQILVTVFTVTSSAADIKSDVAVLKTQIIFMQRDYTDLKAQINNRGKM